MSAVRLSCETCVRRAWLLGRLAPFLERAPRGRAALRDVLSLTDAELIAALGGQHKALLRRAHAGFDVQAAWLQAANAGLEVVCRHDDAYPMALREDGAAPTALYVRGGVDRLRELTTSTWPVDEVPAVAIVGARRATPEALEMARALGRSMSAAGVTVVSGLALGVDSAAHEGALDGGGRTIAVLATGADRTYPRTKTALGERVARAGVIVSELPPGTAPFRWAFPARNRIIAGIARLTLVVEAAERSGSLITSDFALALGREVAAVPGSATSVRCRGSNLLLRDGAHVVLEPADVLDGLLGLGCLPGLAPVPRASGPELSARLREVRDGVASGRGTAAALAGDPARLIDVLAALSELELLGEVRRAPGGAYVAVVR